MLKMTFRTLALASVLILNVSAFAMDGDKKDDRVVASVNGEKIYYSDLELAKEAMGAQAQALPISVIQGLLINSIADRKLVAAKARKEGFDKSEQFKKSFKDIKELFLQREYLTFHAEKSINDEKIQKAYDNLIKDFKPSDELHARHILVETEEAAKEIIAELEKGADFVELAKAKSTGPSGPNGGDLGFFGQGAMVPSFEEAAFALDVGQFTKEPVQTQFGFHVIKLEEKRTTQAPTLDEVRENLEGELANQAVSTLLEGIRKGANIKVFDENGKEIKQDQ